MSLDKIIASIPGMDAKRRAETRSNAERKLDDARMGADARRVIEELDAQEAREAAAFSDRVSNLPVAKRVVEAFSSMTENERNIVQVLLDHPGETSTGLSSALGWGGQTWHMHFGEMCKKRETRLWPAEPAVVRDANFYCGILANLSADNRWTIKPEVAEGFTALGLRANKK
ncbi:hypothetical protein [Mesorhizobium muleiense]|uniref:Uncharacterized protein n=1 Tax=Mesorhizobium muleiense TaxID=1004279 RepID=A0A1G9JNY4_9HYPH|nr:hypothetical protein [Mesorhizobium muleiense]MCF6101810.1 hypothetical protein [Mesorhizobium muleiense]SDL39229.1 hypothetical protein SAMN05428953_13538 [Mesorhizobium muleiense]